MKLEIVNSAGNPNHTIHTTSARSDEDEESEPLPWWLAYPLVVVLILGLMLAFIVMIPFMLLDALADHLVRPQF